MYGTIVDYSATYSAGANLEGLTPKQHLLKIERAKKELLYNKERKQYHTKAILFCLVFFIALLVLNLLSINK